MFRKTILPALALVLALALPAAASEMYPRPNVPSSRTGLKANANKNTTASSLKNAKTTNKIVKTTKAGQTQPTQPASLQ